MLRGPAALGGCVAGMTIASVRNKNTHCRKIVRPRETRMSTQYTIVIEKDEDGYYVGSVPALPVVIAKENPLTNYWNGCMKPLLYGLRSMARMLQVRLNSSAFRESPYEQNAASHR